MTYFCSLHITSDLQSALPVGFLINPKEIEVNFTDNESPDRLAQLIRLRKIGLAKNKPPRYRWILNSDGYVDGADVLEHVTWVLEKINPTISLSQLGCSGYKCWLQFYWEGNGTGGGPEITSAIAALLVKHKIDIRFGFYLEQVE